MNAVARLRSAYVVLATLIAVSCAAPAPPTAMPQATVVAQVATPRPATPPPVATPTELPPLPTEPPLPDPCALASQQEVDAVAGTPLAEGIPAGEPAVYSCTWTGDPEGPLGQVEIYLGENAKKFLDIDRDTLEHEFTDVAGIGDEAWLEENAIFFRKGTMWVALRLVRLNEPAENVEPLTELARRMADRLP